MKEIRLQKDGDQTLWVYGEIGAPEWMDGITSQDVAAALKDADTSQPLLARINSLGGLAYEGIAIYNLLKDWGGVVNVRVDAIAASAASVIAMAGEEITMATGAMMNVHDPWAMTVGPAAEHEKAIAELNTFAEALADIYSERTGLKADAVRTIMADDTTYGAQDAIDSGFADSMVKERAVAACRDASLTPILTAEHNIAAWQPLMGESTSVAAREAAARRLALTRANLRDRIMA